MSHDVERFSTGTTAFETSDDSAGPYGYYEDPNVTGPLGGATSDYLNLQRIFSPEEAGGLRNTMDKNTSNGIRATLGVKGDIFTSKWIYAVDFTYTQNKLTELTSLAFEDPINNFSAPSLARTWASIRFWARTYIRQTMRPFTPRLTPAEYASFTGKATSYSYTEESVARAQLTNSQLFPLPGGNAGLALVVDGGGQGWNYYSGPELPRRRRTYLYTATAGSGHRSRYSGTTPS